MRTANNPEEGEGEKVVKERGHGFEVGRWGKKERIRKKEGHGNRKRGRQRRQRREGDFTLCCRYRYTMEELEKMMLGIQRRAEGYRTWADLVERALDGLESEKAGR